jgi:hypothetical protein
MSSIDDDATVTQLAHAWVGVALGGAKVQEASYIYQELGDKFTWTVSVLLPLLLLGVVLGASWRWWCWSGAGSHAFGGLSFW